MATARPPYEIAKAGWMHRLSSVLRRWKKNWFVLYQNGDFKYFESPNSHEAEECIVVRAECFQVLHGKMVDSGVNPPDGAKREQLLQLKLRSGELTVCAESPDEMRMWQLLLDDARMMHGPPPSHVTMQAPPPYPGQPVTAPPQTVVYPPQATPYPGQTVYTTTTNVAYPRQPVSYAYPGQVCYGTNPPYVQPPVGQTTVIYTDTPRRYRRRYHGDLATGFVAGAALGTVMWSPMLFW